MICYQKMCRQLFVIIFVAAITSHIQCERLQTVLWRGWYNICEGKDSGNYSVVLRQQMDSKCSPDSVQTGPAYFIESGPKGQTSIILAQTLAFSAYPAGAEVLTEFLFLFTSGSLAGKFGFARNKHLVTDYLKKCSSVLGLSTFSFSKVHELLISDRLDPNVLISPTGGYEVFKKGCTTICKGEEHAV